jgi:hypothetical protein
MQVSVTVVGWAWFARRKRHSSEAQRRVEVPPAKPPDAHKKAIKKPLLQTGSFSTSHCASARGVGAFAQGRVGLKD